MRLSLCLLGSHLLLDLLLLLMLDSHQALLAHHVLLIEHLRVLHSIPLILSLLLRLLLRLLCEIAAIVLVTQLILDAWAGAFWAAAVTSIAIMLVVSFVVIGVAPRTLGRQHNERVALWSAAPLSV